MKSYLQNRPFLLKSLRLGSNGREILLHICSSASVPLRGVKGLSVSQPAGLRAKSCLIFLACVCCADLSVRTASDLSLGTFWTHPPFCRPGLHSLFLVDHLALYPYFHLYRKSVIHFHTSWKLELQVRIMCLIWTWDMHRCLHVFDSWRKHITVPVAAGQICCSQVCMSVSGICACFLSA